MVASAFACVRACMCVHTIAQLQPSFRVREEVLMQTLFALFVFCGLGGGLRSQVLQEMLDQIDRQQRNKLKLDNLSLPSPDRHRPLRHQFSSDNMNAQQFNIPNLRIDQRKTSSAEDMARKNSTGTRRGIGMSKRVHAIVVCVS